MTNKQHTDNQDEVYFLGSRDDRPEMQQSDPDHNRRRRLAILGIVAVIVIALIGLYFVLKEDAPAYYFEPENESVATVETQVVDTVTTVEPKGYIEVQEETVNDVPMYIYTPHNAALTLSVGIPDRADSTIICVMQAADIRTDNKDIVGDFVLNGKRLSRGVAKKGFCAVIGDDISVGVSEDTPLLQKSIDESGYFFRQYPLVKNGELVENNPKNKSIRRTLAIRRDKVVMIESRSSESFHDFSQALVDIGVTEAIYLVGSTAHGWYRTEDGKLTEYGTSPDATLTSVSYIVWRVK